MTAEYSMLRCPRCPARPPPASDPLQRSVSAHGCRRTRSRCSPWYTASSAAWQVGVCPLTPGPVPLLRQEQGEQDRNNEERLAPSSDRSRGKAGMGVPGVVVVWANPHKSRKPYGNPFCCL